MARRCFQLRAAGLPHGEVFHLCPTPGRDQQVGDRRAGADDIPGRAGIDPLDETGGPGLDDSDVTLVEIEYASDVQTGRKIAPLNAGLTHAQALDGGWIDPHARGRSWAFVAVAWDQLHIHEG